MHILVQSDLSISLEDEDDLMRFEIVEQEAGHAEKALAGLGVPAEENHFWLDADKIMELAGKSTDPDWIARYRAMLEGAEKYGYFESRTNRVKAHIKQRS